MAKRVCYIQRRPAQDRHEFDPVVLQEKPATIAESMVISCQRAGPFMARITRSLGAVRTGTTGTNSRGRELSPSTRRDSVRSRHHLLGGLGQSLKNRDYAKVFSPGRGAEPRTKARFVPAQPVASINSRYSQVVKGSSSPNRSRLRAGSHSELLASDIRLGSSWPTPMMPN